ncbi:TPA: ESPR-type extended signal peptide-containing protein [Morganella morganii]
MNKIFKVVKNQRTGNSVVASEFAKGAKKGKKLALLSLAMLMGSGLSMSALAADPAGQWLETEYLPAQYDSTTKTWEDNSNEKGKSRVINKGDTKDLNLNNENTKFTNNLDYQDKWFSLEELAKQKDKIGNNILSITQYKNGQPVKDGTPPTVESVQDWQIPSGADMEEIIYKNEQDEDAVLQAYKTNSFKTTLDPKLGVYLLEEQPEVSPFYHLTLAEVKDGILNMTADNDAPVVKWDIKHIKDSSLFVAAADEGKSATIDTTSKLHVTFGEAYGMDLSSDNIANYKFQPKNQLVGEIELPPGITDKHNQGVTIGEKTYRSGEKFTIGNEQELNTYNQILIAAVKNNSLPAADYKAYMEATVIPRPQDQDYYEIDIKIEALRKDNIVLNDAITAAIGRRSIFEAVGDGSVLNIKNGADIRGETSSNSGSHRAYHIFAHKGAKVFHDATTSVPNYKGQNALIVDAEFTNNKTGMLQLGDGKTHIYGDQVMGKTGQYTNLGTIAVEAFNLANNDPSNKDVTANTGVTASGGAGVINKEGAQILLGQKGIGQGQGTVTGVRVVGASFTNEGDILMGGGRGYHSRRRPAG